MRKATARRLLGPTNVEVARACRVTPAAVSQWPAVLPQRIEDRVMAALARKLLPAEVLLQIADDDLVECD